VTQAIFADALVNLSVTGNLVRLDLGVMSLAQTTDNKQDVRLVTTQQLVMPLDGFLKAFNAQEQLIKKLIQEGVLKVEAKSD
jgi:hypothetical protein